VSFLLFPSKLGCTEELKSTYYNFLSSFGSLRSDGWGFGNWQTWGRSFLKSITVLRFGEAERLFLSFSLL